MVSQVLAVLAAGAIPCLGGVLCFLVGFRVLGTRRGVNPRADEWHRRYRPLLFIAGPLLLVVGTFAGLGAFAGPSGSEGSPGKGNWQRFTTSDGVCSAEFPGTPKPQTVTAFGVESQRLTFKRETGGNLYILSHSGFPSGDVEVPVDKRLDAIRDNMPAFLSSMGFQAELLREKRITQDGVPGSEVWFDGEKVVLGAKFFILGKRIYKAIVVILKSDADNDEAERFLATVRFDVGKE
jgi:hypothetical protein